ncbi:hypothetical protein ACKU07_23450 [Enterobacter hormaechei]
MAIKLKIYDLQLVVPEESLLLNRLMKLWPKNSNLSCHSHQDHELAKGLQKSFIEGREMDGTYTLTGKTAKCQVFPTKKLQT